MNHRVTVSIIQKVCMVAGWLALAFITYATLTPIGSRPVVAGPQFEHFAAFALVGLALGLAYPSRGFFVALVVVGSAIVLETLQLLTPDRDGRVLDAVVKATGGICGIGVAKFGINLLRSQIDCTK